MMCTRNNAEDAEAQRSQRDMQRKHKNLCVLCAFASSAFLPESIAREYGHTDHATELRKQQP